MKAYTSPEDEQFFAAIGRLTLSWGHLEFAIDCIVQIMHTTEWGEQIVPEIPRSLQRKISFLRAVFNRFPMGKKATKGWLRLLDHIQSAAQKRHDIIHGFVIKQKEQSGEAEFVRITRKRGKPTFHHINANTESILRLATHTNNLSAKCMRAVSGALDLIDEQRQ